jgi:hypothetical protein
MSTTHLGRYEIIGDLGRGAMGMVYKARDPLIDRSVAVKTVVCQGLAPDEVEACERRFFAEAKCAGRLNHPNIVTIHDVGRDGEVDYMTMEFLAGRSLREVLDSGVVLGADRIADIAAQLADGLAFAHANDVVHCDVKPGNVMVLDNGSVKIADFGVATLPSVSLADDGTAIGSPKYMSPEQVTGQRLDGRSDIFSLGAVLYEMLTGLPPFSGDDLGAVLRQVTEANPTAPSSRRRNLHPGFDIIVAKAMAKDPERRYRSAAAMAVDLRRYRELAVRSAEVFSERELAVGLPAKARSGSTARPRPWRLERPAMAAAMLLTVIVAVRFMPPVAMQPPAAAEPFAPKVAATRAGEGKARAGGTKKASARAADTARTRPAHRAPVGSKREETSWLVKTKLGGSDRQTGGARTPQPIAPNHPTPQLTTQIDAPAREKAESPKQLCADRSNFIARGFCETRTCLQSEWKDHAYCIRKREQDLRSNPLLASSS